MVRIDINLGNMPNMYGGQLGSTMHGGSQKQLVMLTSEMILRYLLGTDEKIETLVLCKPENTELVTTDNNIYEAMGSTTQGDNVQLNKVTKLFEAVHVVSFKQQNGKDKPILKEQRVDELRKAAFAKSKEEASKIINQNKSTR